MSAIDLQTTYLALDGKGQVELLPVGPDFWAKVEQSAAVGGLLVGVYAMTADWPHWEMHPGGAEILTMLEGRMELELDDGRRVWRERLEPGLTVVVPPGAWHRGLVSEPGRLLGITYGDGTRHRPVAS